MEKRFTEKIIKERNKRLKKDTNKFLRTFLFVFVFGYAFFFTSPFWMPNDYTGVKPSEIGKVIEADDREVMPILWEYCEDRQLMNVVIEINNTSIDGKNKYKWSAVDRRKGTLPVKVVLERSDIVQLYVKAKSFTEVSVRMEVEEEKEPIKLYATSRSVKRSKAIKEFSYDECKAISCDAHIAYAEKRIKKAEENIKKEEGTISAAQETISELKEKEEYQTDQEIVETEEKISDISISIETANQKIEEGRRQIEELKEKIKLQKEQKKEYGAGYE